MNTDPEFQKLRDLWALKCIVIQSQIDRERMRDRQANPHNEFNKKPIREDAEIISDLSYTFADKVLKSQYGRDYENWLQQNDYNEVWHVLKRN